MTNIQSKSLIPFCQFIDKSVIHVSIFNMHCVRQLLIHFLYIDGLYPINVKYITTFHQFIYYGSNKHFGYENIMYSIYVPILYIL